MKEKNQYNFRRKLREFFYDIEAEKDNKYSIAHTM